MKGKGKKTNLVPPKGPAPQENIPGVEVMKEAKERSDGYKKGGRTKHKKDGGMADGGECAPGRMDRAPRKASGGSTGANMRGRSPLSSASSSSPAQNAGKSGGYY